jgi:cell division protein FtsB
MKILMLSLLVMVLALQFKLWVSGGGMREVWRLRKQVTAQQEVNEGLKERNRSLAGEVQDLKSGKSAIEERARTDLGMVGPNETFFQVATEGKAGGEVVTPTESTQPVTEVHTERTLMTKRQPESTTAKPSINATQADSH